MDEDILTIFWGCNFQKKARKNKDANLKDYQVSYMQENINPYPNPTLTLALTLTLTLSLTLTLTLTLTKWKPKHVFCGKHFRYERGT